jgi:hypothetical protein
MGSKRGASATLKLMVFIAFIDPKKKDEVNE